MRSVSTLHTRQALFGQVCNWCQFPVCGLLVWYIFAFALFLVIGKNFASSLREQYFCPIFFNFTLTQDPVVYFVDNVLNPAGLVSCHGSVLAPTITIHMVDRNVDSLFIQPQVLLQNQWVHLQGSSGAILVLHLTPSLLRKMTQSNFRRHGSTWSQQL